MKIIINDPQSLNEIGGRSNNEDSIFPLLGNASNDDRLFLVCDGVGGNEKGEMASRLVCDSFAKYFEQKPTETSNEAYIAEALKYAEANIDKYISENPQATGMGTTLTLLDLQNDKAIIAHIGDSRVYQIRNGEIVFVTSDHSMVNKLLKEGILTIEQAKDHPQKNVITRAIQGKNIKPTKADVFIQGDVQVGDYFFLCTDGILEQISDIILCDIISANTSDEEKKDEINLRCKGKTQDNYSCYLIPVKEGKAEKQEKNKAVEHEEVVVQAEIVGEEVLSAEVVTEKEEPEEETSVQDDLKKISKKIGKIALQKLKEIIPEKDVF